MLISHNQVNIFMKFKTLSIFLLSLSSCALYQNQANASVTLGGTRFVYNESEDSLSVTIYDRDKGPYLVQSWVSEFKAQENDNVGKNKMAVKLPFIITPPLFRMEPGDTNTINIVKTDTSQLPHDRESVFYFNVKAIPGKQKDNKSSLMISVDSSMKLFFRPAKLEGDSADSAWEKMSFQQSNKSLIAKNPTPYFVTLHTLSTNGQMNSAIKNTLISPYGQITVPVKASVHSVSWTALSDEGAITSDHNINI